MHEQTGPEGPSGFGFELTMRLKREEGEKSPPTWPAAIMQALAKYVFQSGLETVICKLSLCTNFQTFNAGNVSDIWWKLMEVSFHVMIFFRWEYVEIT